MSDHGESNFYLFYYHLDNWHLIGLITKLLSAGVFTMPCCPVRSPVDSVSNSVLMWPSSCHEAAFDQPREGHFFHSLSRCRHTLIRGWIGREETLLLFWSRLLFVNVLPGDDSDIIVIQVNGNNWCENFIVNWKRAHILLEREKIVNGGATREKHLFLSLRLTQPSPSSHKWHSDSSKQ